MIRGKQVDWTIRLIVVNSKLSGANSFQATMEHCFGKTGLVAISVSFGVEDWILMVELANHVGRLLSGLCEYWRLLRAYSIHVLILLV